MNKNEGNILVVLLAILALAGGIWLAFINKTDNTTLTAIREEVIKPITQQPISTPRATLPPVPNQYQLNGASHSFQTFNNCGPASLSMALSLYDINVSQQVLGNELRPYQNAAGDNDDKSVTLEELAEKAKDYGFLTYLRPSGDMETVERFISNDMPVITRTLLETGDDIGHYRVITGYNINAEYIVQNDSLQGRDLQFSYDEFIELWKPYGYEYLVLVPEEKKEIAEAILGENLDEKVAWENALERLDEEIKQNPNDIQLQFSRSVAYYHVGEYEQSIEQFEDIESRLSFRTLWYQIEPLLAYQELGQYDELLPRIENVLNNHNRAYSELYQIRGEVYLEQGRTADARREFETALVYKSNYEPARDALARL